MPMPQIAMLFGAMLCALGAYGYFGAGGDKVSFTALIPAFFGVPLIVCGLVALKDSLRKHAMHGAAVFGLLGAFAAWGRGLSKIGTLFGGEGNKRAVIMVLIMAVLCTVFLVMCVQSFIAARRRQREAAAESSE